MTDQNYLDFCSVLRKRQFTGDFQQEVLRHEMGATINRHQLTGQQEGINSFNTSQLSSVVASNAAWTRDHVMVHSLLVSALIDDDHDIFQSAKQYAIIPEKWTWVTWADGFSGNENDLCAQLKLITNPRERCGAVCLATRLNPNCIGKFLLNEFCHPHAATIYHCLLRRALTGSQAKTIATNELTRLATHLEVLFAENTDKTLAALVELSDSDHPEKLVAPFRDAVGEWTNTAIARRHLEHGRAKEALALVKDLRFLSPAYEQATMIAALAALETKQFEKAEFYSRSISDEDARLKIVTRLAQATGDAAAEIDALTCLYERHQRDAQIFVQLINALAKINQGDLIAALCADAQERFMDDAMVNGIIQRVLSPR
jgi:hypothetical protein